MSKMPKKTKAESRSKILKCIVTCLEEQKFPHVLNWINRTEKIFVIQFIHKNNPAWHVGYLDLFKELDGLSKRKLETYLKKPGYESDCKVRCRSNLKKLCDEGVLSFRGRVPKEDSKSKISLCYKLNDVSGIYIKEPEKVGIENACDASVTSLDSCGNFSNFNILENQKNMDYGVDFTCVGVRSVEGPVTYNNIENDFHVEKSIPYIENPVSHGHDVSEYANNWKNIKNAVLQENVYFDENIVFNEYAANVSEYANNWKNINGALVKNSSLDENIVSHGYAANVSEYANNWKNINGALVKNSSLDENETFEEAIGILDGTQQADFSLYQNIPRILNMIKDSYSYDEMNTTTLNQLIVPEISFNLNDLQSLDFLEENDKGLQTEDPLLCCGSRGSCTCMKEQVMANVEFDQMEGFPRNLSN